MPLPKPPASKATLLSATDYETQAAARAAKRSLQPSADSNKEPLTLRPAEAPVSAPRQEIKPARPIAPVPAAKPR
ncbi:MAG TPA: PhoH family protein, partial [Burkholderiaceae bacterium]|nr:PhoH family protein [Burkholderiaceae bacterium]